MNPVYFSPTLEPILAQFDLAALGERVALKVHFGERGCVTFLDPSHARTVCRALEAAGKRPALVECNVLYRGSRVNTASHLAVAREHGFTDLPIDILDGEHGDEFVEIDGCKLGRGLERYDALVVLSHFKGHMGSGFGGTLKNVGMGLGSRAGKLFMHSDLRPSSDPATCTGCGVCVTHCNANAITLAGGNAVIDRDACEGCAMCIAVCAFGAIEVPWHGGTNDELQRKIAVYAKAALSRFPGAVFINVLKNITEHCDCMDTVQTPVMPDIGIVAGSDPVAVDAASLDLANERSQGAFDRINGVSKRRQLEHAAALGLGSPAYELRIL